MPKLLLLVSSANEIELADGSRHETGFFAEEALTPYQRFVQAGVDVVVATPDGQAPHPDSYGLEVIFHYPDEDEDFLASITRTFAHDVDDIRLTLHHFTELGLVAARRAFLRFRDAGQPPEEARETISRAAHDAWRNDRQFIDALIDQGLPPGLSRRDLEQCLTEVLAEAQQQAERMRDTLAALPDFQQPRSLSAITDEELATFDAVFVPGGHGPMVDLANNPDVARVLAVLHRKRATIASLCHGPAFLLSAPANTDGQFLFDGYRITAFTDEEEAQTRVGKLGLTWTLETALRNAGIVFDDGRAAFASHVVVDRNLITAQNPKSADAVADAVLKALNTL